MKRACRRVKLFKVRLARASPAARAAPSSTVGVACANAAGASATEAKPRRAVRLNMGVMWPKRVAKKRVHPVRRYGGGVQVRFRRRGSWEWGIGSRRARPTPRAFRPLPTPIPYSRQAGRRGARDALRSSQIVRRPLRTNACASDAPRFRSFFPDVGRQELLLRLRRQMRTHQQGRQFAQYPRRLSSTQHCRFCVRDPEAPDHTVRIPVCGFSERAWLSRFRLGPLRSPRRPVLTPLKGSVHFEILPYVRRGDDKAGAGGVG